MYKIMWNRLTAIMVMYAFVLAWVVIYGTNVYLNAFVLYFGSMAAILACSYVLGSKKKTFGEKWLIGLFSNSPLFF